MKDSPTSGHLEVLFEFDVQPAGVVCMFVVHLFEGLAPTEGVTGGVLGMSVRRRRAADTMNASSGESRGRTRVCGGSGGVEHRVAKLPFVGYDDAPKGMLEEASDTTKCLVNRFGICVEQMGKLE